MLNKYFKKCSISLDIREIKTALRLYLTLVRMAIIKKTNDNKCLRGHRNPHTLLMRM